ncbi:MAG: hypothetical protein L3J69_12675 [Desulfobacula sp.]|nr:hypothetical protein [Desulfobacula sp.]
MNSIQTQPIAAGLSPNTLALSDARVASYMRKQSVSTYESMNAGLTIQTKEGDMVTLSSNTYAQLDAFMYDNKGVVQTENGIAVTSRSQREITLTSGDSFTFSVVGDLSEEELADIEEIVKKIDEIISEMAEGDMDEAVEKALAIGAYDTVSMYSADLKYEKSYTLVTETQAREATINTSPGSQSLPEDRPGYPTGLQLFPENQVPANKGQNSIKDIFKFIEKMTEELEKYEDKQLARSQKGIDKLFNHYLKGEKQNPGSQISAFNAIEKAQKYIDQYIDKITSRLFENTLSFL